MSLRGRYSRATRAAHQRNTKHRLASLNRLKCEYIVLPAIVYLQQHRAWSGTRGTGETGSSITYFLPSCSATSKINSGAPSHAASGMIRAVTCFAPAHHPAMSFRNAAAASYNRLLTFKSLALHEGDVYITNRLANRGTILHCCMLEAMAAIFAAWLSATDFAAASFASISLWGP